MNKEHFELHQPVTEPIAAIKHLADHCDLSKQQLKQAMQKGAVWITPQSKVSRASSGTQRLRRAKKELQAGDCLHFYYDRVILEYDMTPAELVSDFGDYSVWNKPYGVYSQGSKWGDHCTIAYWVQHNLEPQRPVFVIHRLDRATNGLMLLAHTKRAARLLSQMFEQRKLEKKYRALVHGRFSSALQTVNTPIDSRSACSHFSLDQFYPDTDQSLVDVAIESGRKHQIRRHLSELGFPIVGDRLHGIEKTVNTGMDLQLCAYRLVFTCPLTGEHRHFELGN